MNFQFYLERLKNSDVFEEFVKENPEAYLCSGFFTIDAEGEDNQRHIDFYIPEKEEVVSFKLDNLENEKEKSVEKILSQGKLGTDIQQEFLVPEEISSEVNFDFDRIREIIEEEIKKQDLKNKIQKIMVSLQKVKGEELLVCTVFVSMFGLLNIRINPKSQSIVHFEKKSLLDFVRKG